MHDDLVYREASLTGTRTKVVSGFRPDLLITGHRGTESPRTDFHSV